MPWPFFRSSPPAAIAVKGGQDVAASLAFHVVSARELPRLDELFLDPEIPGAAREATRLYFGSDFCAHLLPSASDLESAVRFSEHRGLALTLVTAYGGDRFLDRVGSLLDRLPPGGEVVANDWGTLRLVSRSGRHLPVLGRLLAKLMRDPWVQLEWTRQGEPPPSLELPGRLMGSLGVRRAEVGALPGGLLPRVRANGIELSLCLPWSPLATGRLCLAGSFGAARSPRFGIIEECARLCRQVHIELRDPQAPECPDVDRTVLAGNTLLYRHPQEAVRKALDTLPPAVTRIVWEPWTPA